MGLLADRDRHRPQAHEGEIATDGGHRLLKVANKPGLALAQPLPSSAKFFMEQIDALVFRPIARRQDLAGLLHTRPLTGLCGISHLLVLL